MWVGQRKNGFCGLLKRDPHGQVLTQTAKPYDDTVPEEVFMAH
jgi:hypothetical protein